jgi:hypothetical protein
LDDNLLGDDGLENAQRFILWVGNGMPGYEYRRKASEVVSSSPYENKYIVCN